MNKTCVFITGTNAVGKSTLAKALIDRYGGIRQTGERLTICGDPRVCFAGKYVEGGKFGGLHGKDLSKADVSVNIFVHLLAQSVGQPVGACCAIGDTEIGGTPYEFIVRSAREYINRIGGFEKFAEWGLI